MGEGFSPFLPYTLVWPHCTPLHGLWHSNIRNLWLPLFIIVCSVPKFEIIYRCPINKIHCHIVRITGHIPVIIVTENKILVLMAVEVTNDIILVDCLHKPLESPLLIFWQPFLHQIFVRSCLGIGCCKLPLMAFSKGLSFIKKNATAASSLRRSSSISLAFKL